MSDQDINNFNEEINSIKEMLLQFNAVFNNFNARLSALEDFLESALKPEKIIPFQ